MKKRIAQLLLRLFGWRIEGEKPDAARLVVLAAPHTSNWDLLYLLLMAFVLELPIRWMGKHTLFKGVSGRALRFLGGIPIDRRQPGGMVQAMVNFFDDAKSESEAVAVVIPPGGTRAWTPCWKSGFYHIALGAGVPVSTGFLHYPTRVGGLGPSIELTGDVSADMERFRQFYSDKVGKFPDQTSTVRLREEDENAAD